MISATYISGRIKRAAWVCEEETGYRIEPLWVFMDKLQRIYSAIDLRVGTAMELRRSAYRCPGAGDFPIACDEGAKYVCLRDAWNYLKKKKLLFISKCHVCGKRRTEWDSIERGRQTIEGGLLIDVYEPTNEYGVCVHDWLNEWRVYDYLRLNQKTTKYFTESFQVCSSKCFDEACHRINKRRKKWRKAVRKQQRQLAEVESAKSALREIKGYLKRPSERGAQRLREVESKVLGI
jgi:hypothetical protein